MYLLTVNSASPSTIMCSVCSSIHPSYTLSVGVLFSSLDVGDPLNYMYAAHTGTELARIPVHRSAVSTDTTLVYHRSHCTHYTVHVHIVQCVWVLLSRFVGEMSYNSDLFLIQTDSSPSVLTVDMWYHMHGLHWTLPLQYTYT